MASSRRSHIFDRQKGQFASKCGCLNHDYFSPESKVLLKTKNVLRRASFQALVQKNLITDRKKYVCRQCLKYSQDNFVSSITLRTSFGGSSIDDDLCLIDTSFNGACTVESDISLTDTSFNSVESDACLKDTSFNSVQNDAFLKDPVSIECQKDDFEESLDHLICQLSIYPDWETLQESLKTKMCNLANILGSLICNSLYSDGKSFEFRNIETDKSEWLKRRNPLLLSFLTAATNFDDNCASVRKENAIVHAVEQIYYARNLKVVTPFSFQRNVVQYSITNSKICANLMGSWESSGSYTTVHDFISSDSDSVKCPPGYIHNAIDNNQKIGRSSGRIKEGAKVPIDICTSVSHLLIDSESNIQSRDDLKPSSWQDYSIKNLPKVMSNIKNLEDSIKGVFATYRNDYVRELLKEVITEQSHSDGKTTDKIDICIKQKELGMSNQVCYVCSFVYPQTLVSCPKCAHDPSHHPMGFEPYYRTKSFHIDPPKVIVGEPVMVNPNNESNVHKVIDHMRQVCNMPSERKWTVVWSDGLPYLFGSGLQQYYVQCTVCEEVLDTRKITCQEHVANKHDSHTFQIAFINYFGDIIFRPGPGHIEMNMARCLLKYCWPVLQHLVQLLGFRTPRAQEVVLAGKDHHRSKQILLTLLESSARELLVPFVRTLDSERTEVLSTEYFEWVQSEVRDPNNFYLFDLVFTFLLSFKMYNEAVRKNNHKRMLAAWVYFGPLFFSRNHANYQELFLRDLCESVQYPLELSEEMSKTESFTVSGISFKGQGADFIHEEVNKLNLSYHLGFQLQQFGKECVARLTY